MKEEILMDLLLEALPYIEDGIESNMSLFSREGQRKAKELLKKVRKAIEDSK